ncbi:MAG: hypothetical protein JW993_09055 [Sedimentisphaerales bacterium]|nr:hypothetical protein [Sedimentisphaerales bacterium]
MKVARIPGFLVCLLLVGAAWGAGITPISQKLDHTDNYNEWLTKTLPPQDPDRIVFIPPWATLNNDDPYVLDHTPYYRGAWEDWGWTHNLLSRVPDDANGIESATLTIEAWDVNPDPDPADPFDMGPEIDEIIINSTQIGILDETPVYQWGTTTFTLPPSILDDLWTDGEIYVLFNIDKLNGGHRVTLGSSTLTVNYTVSGPGRGAVQPMFRFWSPSLAHHFYTTSESDRNAVMEYWPDTWSDYEGTVYYLPINEGGSDPNAQPVYRFWSDLFGAHFYTIDPDDKNYVLATWPDVWAYEGPVFYAYPAGSQPADSKPVYRFWSESLRGHFYTIDEDEKSYVLATWPDTWTYEEIAWYAYDK